MGERHKLSQWDLRRSIKIIAGLKSLGPTTLALMSMWFSVLTQIYADAKSAHVPALTATYV